MGHRQATVADPRGLKKLLNPMLGKSLIVQATKSPLRSERLTEIREAADARS